LRERKLSYFAVADAWSSVLYFNRVFFLIYSQVRDLEGEIKVNADELKNSEIYGRKLKTG